MVEYAYLVFFFEYTFAFKWKSTRKLTDLLEIEEKFSFPFLRETTAEGERSTIWLPSSALSFVDALNKIYSLLDLLT